MAGSAPPDWLAAVLGQGGMAGAAPAAPQQQLTMSDLISMLSGTARESTSSHKFVGPMPLWVPKTVQPYVQDGTIDPYLGAGQSTQEAWRVYMGSQTIHGKKTIQKTFAGKDGQEPRVQTVKGPGTTKADKAVTMQQAMNEPYLWNEDDVATAIKKFHDAGMTDVTDFDTLTKAWGTLVQRAGSMYSLSGGERKVTPWDVLGMYKNEQLKSGVKPGPGDPNFNGATTQISRNVSDVNEGEAWSAVRSTVANMLGRDPSDHEVRDFTYRMSTLAAHNPSISKTITQYQNGQAVGQTTHTTPGFSSADMAQEAYQHAQADPNYAEYQSASTYFNAAASALGAIGGN